MILQLILATALSPAPQPYTANTLNRSLVAADFAGHLTDAISTHQFEVDPCHCIVEKGTFYGTFSLAPVSRSTPALLGYSLGLSAANVMVSRKLWQMSQKRHSKALRLASRAVLMYDIGVEGRVSINNWRLIATQGKKGF